jgi:PIN domain nuclease of toxin-antitoxin system
MRSSVLLDTCAVIWTLKHAPLSIASRNAIRRAFSTNAGVYVSPFSAWEIGMLVSKGHIELSRAPEMLFDELIAMPGTRLAPLTPRILLSSSFLPGTPPKDLADRIIAATARELGHILITRDTKLLAYAQQGHIRAIAC